jgi:hypothetical protein
MKTMLIGAGLLLGLVTHGVPSVSFRVGDERHLQDHLPEREDLRGSGQNRQHQLLR